MPNKFKGRVTRLISRSSVARNLNIKPASRLFGLDRGLPIDRYYIEKFLFGNKHLIKGIVLEVGESIYTKKFGGKKVEKALVLHVNQDNRKADIVGDLSTGKGIPKNLADCFIMTQTLPFIFDIHGVARNAIKILKPGGYLLATTPGISQISRYDMNKWGHYWSFTDLSLRKLFGEVVPSKYIKVRTYGNVKAAACFLYGLAQEEVLQRDLNYRDPDYQVVVAVVVRKPAI